MVSDIDKKKVLEYLSEVSDPEIPVLTLEDMGIIRDVEQKDDTWIVTITPTYSGCPAMDVIEEDIAAKLKEKGIESFEIKTVLSPAWTTDWMSEEGKRKLKEYGIAPPEGSADKSTLTGEPKTVQCPLCGSKNTELTSQFGSTPCKALYRCKDCLEPFDYFKCI